MFKIIISYKEIKLLLKNKKDIYLSILAITQ